jgi:two-component system chemotaxis sensor kinase CheA
MDDLLTEFLTESSDNLARLDGEIVDLERTPDDRELLKSIFRTVHTIKGTCGFLDLARLERVAHAAENVLGLLRDGELRATPEIINDVLEAIDTIKLILRALEETSVEPDGDDTALLDRLGHWMVGHEVEDVSVEILLARKAASGVTSALMAGGQAHLPALSPHSDAVEKVEVRSAIADGNLRVGVGVLDLLMNLAGELVLTRNQLLQLIQDDDDSAFRLPLNHLNQVTTELQEAVMKTRMQPIGYAWQKLPRLVRDLCNSSGKQIDLQMLGVETELDRQILQAIGDPLTHMVRNSADHGIELPEVRLAAGKPETGSIILEAFHEGGHIVIEVRDDGKGLDVEAIRRKAVERHLVRSEAAATLSDSQTFRFIFEPGFSTATQVTSVSGRGVGMDVVRANIESIGGMVDITSAFGRGTTMRVKIPLTLAILSALIVGAGGQCFAVPQIGVVELVGIGDENRTLVENVNGSSFLRLRDKLLPLVRLADILGLRPMAETTNIVVCHVGGYRFGLVVEEIYDTQEIVVKPLGRMVKAVKFYSGTTILGDGQVIMILDVPGISTLTLAGETAEAAAEEDNGDAESEVAVAEELVSLIVFSSGGGNRQAVPLALVSRLERIPSESIEFADGRWMVQYRGMLLPLVPASDAIDMAAPGERPVIVFSDGGRSMGLAVEEITDIVEDRLEIQTESMSPGIIGAAVVGGRSAEIIDIHHFLRSADPAWFRFQAIAGPRQRVLVVDDSPFFLNTIAPVLRTSRFQVVTATDGEEALLRLDAGEMFDLIITDIDMPIIDGWELRRRLRVHPVWCDIPILALTGRNGAGDRQTASELGFRDYLEKFDRDVVLTAVHAALGSAAEVGA